MATILIADEDQAARECIKLVLHGSYQIHDAGSPEAVEDILAAHAVDLVLIDSDMTAETGQRCVPQLRARYPEQPLVLLCLGRECDAIRSAMQVDALDYLLKPFDIDRLRFVLQRAFQFIALLPGRSAAVPQPPQTTQQPDDPCRRTLDALDELIGQVTLKQVTDDVERTMIAQALEKTNKVQTQAAELLGTTRRILRYKMEQYGLD